MNATAEISAECASQWQTPLDIRALRHALGSYPTGVAIVTSRAACGRPVGLTINSFASLSLDPPLVLWSLSSRSPSMAAFCDSRYFCINVLASNQDGLARAFANPDVADKFALVPPYSSPERMPLIPGSLSSFVCATELAQEAGDHKLFVGRVLRYYSEAGEPAVYHRGRFTKLQELRI
ncbi:flavin reductase family protein [Pseudoduganella ginsengisoli]|uniref:Flavin reductase n=1 Tax=Pseudoduganella ginsengisoli TaxID=1462440 RepID=A0A6L6Q7M0_9BURK|nr:flavin reductase family protein [Pseudoduganella ginsengisoli]MTW05218.1 flavin reductase [Pseudoduganella ginsengisoli]